MNVGTKSHETGVWNYIYFDWRNYNWSMLLDKICVYSNLDMVKSYTFFAVAINFAFLVFCIYLQKSALQIYLEYFKFLWHYFLKQYVTWWKLANPIFGVKVLMENDRRYNVLHGYGNDNIIFIYSTFAMAVDLYRNFIWQSSVQLKLYWEIVAISIFNYKIKTTSFPSKCFLIATAIYG